MKKAGWFFPASFVRSWTFALVSNLSWDELGPDALVLKRVDLRAMIEDIIEKAKNVDLDRLEEEIEEEANRLARKKYQVLD
jgi:hypothetical protein